MEALMMLRSAESPPFQPRLARAGRRGVRGLRSSWRTPEESADGGIPMYRLLVPVKESGTCLWDMELFLKNSGWCKNTMEIHLLHVQRAVRQGVSMLVIPGRRSRFCSDDGIKVLQEARARLNAAGVSCVSQMGIGDDPAPVIARYARDKQCDHIFMGAGSRGEIAGLLLRPVTRKVIRISEVPVLLLARQLDARA